MTKSNSQLDIEAAQTIIQNLDAIEERIRMIRGYVNVQEGKVTGTNIVATMFMGIERNLREVGNGIVRFL